MRHPAFGAMLPRRQPYVATSDLAGSLLGMQPIPLRLRHTLGRIHLTVTFILLALVGCPTRPSADAGSRTASAATRDATNPTTQPAAAPPVPASAFREASREVLRAVLARTANDPPLAAVEDVQVGESREVDGS